MIKKVLLLILISISSFAQTKPTLAVLYSRSSDKIEVFENLIDATNFAIAQYNKIHHTSFEFNIVPIDEYKDNPDLAERALKNLIKKDKPIAILGPSYSNVGLALKGFINKNKIPAISIFATHNDLTKNSEYIFRICASNKKMVKTLADYLIPQINKNKLNVTVFKDLSDSYSIDLAESFESSLSDTKTNINDVLFRGIDGLDRLKDINSKVWSPNKKEILFLPTQDNVSSRILTSMESVPYMVATIEPVNFMGLFKKLKKVKTHIKMISTAQWLPGKSAFSKKMENAYLNQYKTELKIPTALTVDAAFAFLSAYERSIKKKIPLLDALKDGTKVQGLTGNLAFDKDGERVTTGSFIKKDFLK